MDKIARWEEKEGCLGRILSGWQREDGYQTGASVRWWIFTSDMMLKGPHVCNAFR